MPERRKPLLIILLIASFLNLRPDASLAAPADDSESGRAPIAAPRTVGFRTVSLDALRRWIERLITSLSESQADEPGRSATVDPWGLDPEATPPPPPNPGAAATGG